MASSGVPQTGAIPVSAPVVSHWEEHRELFHELYNTRSLPLEKVKEIAEEVHQLPRAPLSSYETKLRDELGLRKNLKGEDWAVIGRLVASRPQANVYHHGKIIPRDKLKRTIRRYSKVKIREAVELTDAQDLGLLSPSGSAPAFTPSTEPRSSHHFASHLSTFKDPFHALGIILHRLSNNVAVDDISELMDQFAQQIPEPLFMAVLQLDCPTRAIECGGDPDQHVNLRGRQGELSGTSPLIYAAINGNTDTVKMLLECGADVNFRVDGFTAAGHLLVVLKKDTQHREHRTEVLRLLLDRGSDINALFRRDNLYYSSEATLLDEAILGDDADVTEIFREFSSASTTGRPTVSLSGIITCAKESTEKLRNYILKLPPGKKWERMQVAALTWCLDRTNVQATLAMTEVGFTLTRLFTKEPGFFWQGWQPGPILDFFTSVYRDSPLTTLSERLARVILEEPQDTDVRNALIKSCLGSSHPEVLRLLFRVLAQLRGNGAEMMAIAARFDIVVFQRFNWSEMSKQSSFF
ncbi:hypothetical protein OQA88_8631 [Cercophora sp. LCS_1]